jgi:hypothetical protein
MDHIARCPWSWFDIQLHDRIVYVLEETKNKNVHNNTKLMVAVFGRTCAHA